MANKWEGIVKVQVPLGGNDMSQALIYNEDRSIQVMVPVEEVNPMMGGRVKVYAHAKVNRKGLLLIGDEAGEQAW